MVAEIEVENTMYVYGVEYYGDLRAVMRGHILQARGRRSARTAPQS